MIKAFKFILWPIQDKNTNNFLPAYLFGKKYIYSLTIPCEFVFLFPIKTDP